MIPTKTQDEPLYPLSIFVYNDDGTHGEPTKVKDEHELYSPITTEMVAKAFAEGKKIVMTDPADLCVFHAEDHEVIFPPVGPSSTVVLVVEV